MTGAAAPRYPKAQSSIKEFFFYFPILKSETMVIFEDSFDVFQLIKAAIVQNGYEYRPIPLKPGESVVDSGGRGEAQ